MAKKRRTLTSEQARRMAKRPRRPRYIMVAVRDLLECSDAQELKSEMESWRDNMDGTGLENTEKYSSVSEAADALDYVVDEMESNLNNLIELLDKSEAGKKVLDTKIQVSNRRVDSRADRAGALNDQIGRAVDAIKSGLPEDHEAVAMAEEVAEQSEEVSMVDFPGMY